MVLRLTMSNVTNRNIVLLSLIELVDPIIVGRCNFHAITNFGRK